VRKALESVPGVRQVAFDYGTKNATVFVEKDKLDPAALVASLEKEGFGGDVAP